MGNELKPCRDCGCEVRPGSAYCFNCLTQKSSDYPLELLAEIMRYRQGRPPYDFSRLPVEGRWLAADEAWEGLQTRAMALLEREGVEL